MNYSSLILFSSAQNYIYIYIYIYMRFARGSPCSVLLAFSQSYVKYDLKKKKLEYCFFANKLIFMS
jgi:hypothetical protein